MEGEQDRLERMYGELGDEHLRDLAGDRESLTADGQMALARVLAARGMAAGPAAETPLPAMPGEELEQGFTPGIPGVIPSGAGTMEQALEHGGARRDGMVRLITLFDGTDLTKACAVLEAQNFDFALEPMERDEQSGAPTSFAIWVDEGDETAGQDLLRKQMGLFPLAEVAGEQGAEYADDLMTLGEFETSTEAERVKSLLAGAGIGCSVVSEENAHGEMLHTVEVQGSDLERGLQVAQRGLGVGQVE